MNLTQSSHLALGLVSLGLTLGTVQSHAQAQDYTADPLYGTVRLSTGFLPDPHLVSVYAGGTVDASTLGLGAECVGFIQPEQPDLRLHYTAGSTFMLGIGAVSDADTTLVINGPDGRWYCNDDYDGSLNPFVFFPTTMSGQYDIWVGTFSRNNAQAATLAITEF